MTQRGHDNTCELQSRKERQSFLFLVSLYLPTKLNTDAPASSLGFISYCRDCANYRLEAACTPIFRTRELNQKTFSARKYNATQAEVLIHLRECSHCHLSAH